MSLIVNNLVSALTPNHEASATALTVGAAAVSGPSLHSRTDAVLVSVSGADSRVTYDGSTPSASNGHEFADSSMFYISRAAAEVISFFVETGSATVRFTEFKYTRTSKRRGSLQTVPFLTLFNAIVRAKELDPAEAVLSEAQSEMIAEHAEMAIQTAWEHLMWPDLTHIEKRSVVESTLTDDDGESEGVLRYIPRSESGAWDIGTVKSISEKNPNASRAPGYLEFDAGADGLYVGPLGGSSLWVRYRTRPPSYTRQNWKPMTDYVAGDVRYWDATGECYVALQDVDGSEDITPANLEFWDICPVPKLFFHYARFYAAGLWMEEDGMERRSAVKLGRADKELERISLKEIDQQNQQESSRVEVA